MKKIYMIGNTHFDPVWLWRWDEAMASIHSTFRSALDRMNEDKDFIYSFATPPVFEWIKKTDPDMFEEIKARVEEGRWELPEGWWLQPDCFSASGESYARQSLYGQRYLYENFGGYADTVFNIDSFGHNSQTPQILKKSGMKNYVLCRPENRHIPMDLPYFNWVGKDGSTVRAFRAGQFCEVYNKDMDAAVDMAEKAMQNANCSEMMVYGVTNHGGAPTKKAIADIHRLAKEKDYTIKFSTVSNFFLEEGEPELSVKGELLTGDFGPYVNNVKIKKLCRIAEYTALNAEKASVIAKKLINCGYPKEKLDEIWKDIMFNQFHDILGGASIKEAYFDAENQLGRAITDANEITKFALTAITHKIKMPGKNPENAWNLTVWNLNPAPYDGYIEAELQWLHEFPAYDGGIMLEDENGEKYETQKILEGSVIKGFRSRILFKAEIGALGYKTFKVIKTEKSDSISDYESKTSVNAGSFAVEFDKETGFIKTLKNTVTNRVWHSPITPAVFDDQGDTWCFNVSGYGKEFGKFKFKGISITETGIHRTTVKTIHSFKNSTLAIYYTFYRDYFDISYRVNFSEKHAVLKLILNFGYENLLASSPFASEERCDGERDVPMGEWLYSYGNGGGALIISNAAFAYNKKSSEIGISLLRSCIFGDLRIGDLPLADYPYMEQGITEGKLRIIPEICELNSKYVNNSVHFNNPPIVICDSNHDGCFSPEDSFIGFDSESAAISAIKEGYADDSEIIRLYEYLGKEQDAAINYFGKNFSIKLTPYEIKTLKIKDGKISDSNIIEE